MRPDDIDPYAKSNDDTEEWIVSYADMVTLLLCFFILFFSANKSQESQEIIRELSSVFTKGEENAKPVPRATKEVANSDKSDGDLSFRQNLNEIEANIKESLEGTDISKVEYEVIRRRNELRIRFWGQEFFQKNEWLLNKDAYQALLNFSERLRPYDGKVKIIVEGHADKASFVSRQVFRNNLALSTLRSATAANVLVEKGLSADNIRTLGMSDAKPIFKEGSTEEVDYPRSRRIEIRIVELKEPVFEGLNAGGSSE